MNSTNSSFFEACKSPQIPGKYARVACTQDKVIFALSELKQATADVIAARLSEFEPSVNTYTHQKNTREVLDYLFDKGMVKITRQNGELSYNLV